MPVESMAKLKYVSIPPRKMRLVADMVKGMPVEDAINLMNYTPRIAARHIAKTLKSAAANALSVAGSSSFNPEDLVVKGIFVDEAPSAKRIRFRSMGRVYRYKKRFCHLTVKLVEVEAKMPASVTASEAAETKEKEAPAKEATAKKTAAKKTAAKKAAAKKTTAKKATAKKATAKKATAKKAAAKKSADADAK